MLKALFLSLSLFSLATLSVTQSLPIFGGQPRVKGVKETRRRKEEGKETRTGFAQQLTADCEEENQFRRESDLRNFSKFNCYTRTRRGTRTGVIFPEPACQPAEEE